MPFCENCGNKVSETSKFCSSCGGKTFSSQERNTNIENTKSDTLHHNLLDNYKIETKKGFSNIPSKSSLSTSPPKSSTLILIFSVFTLLLLSGIVLIVKSSYKSQEELNLMEVDPTEEDFVIPSEKDISIEEILPIGLEYKYDAENVIFRNNSTFTAYFKIAYYDNETNKWEVADSYKVVAGQEFDFKLDFYTFNKIYWMAENEDGMGWHGTDTYLNDKSGKTLGFFELVLKTGTTYHSISN
jgi:hypothetical protein